MSSEYTVIPVRAKYRLASTAKRNPYRARTGPRCCGPGCPSTYKKGQKVVKKR